MTVVGVFECTKRADRVGVDFREECRGESVAVVDLRAVFEATSRRIVPATREGSGGEQVVVFFEYRRQILGCRLIGVVDESHRSEQSIVREGEILLEIVAVRAAVLVDGLRGLRGGGRRPTWTAMSKSIRRAGNAQPREVRLSLSRAVVRGY